MYMGPEMMQYLQQLHEYLHVQSKNMEAMKKLIEKLNRDIDELKERQAPPPVIKNEYKFDLLKVERLEGTLNIGLNPKGADGGMGEYAINPSTQDTPAPDRSDSPAFARVQKEIHDYLSHDAYGVLERIEEEAGYPLDDTYRTFIMDDIKKQIDSRIRYYLNQAQAEGWEPEQMDALCERTIQKVKRDIERTCETFVKNLPRGVNDTGHDL